MAPTVAVIPHLTLAASTDEDLLDRVANQAADALPIKARAETACIVQRVGELWRLGAEFLSESSWANSASDFRVISACCASTGTSLATSPRSGWRRAVRRLLRVANCAPGRYSALREL